MSRYDELLTEMSKIAVEISELGNEIDPTNALSRCARLENWCRALMWVNAQTLKELARVTSDQQSEVQK